MTTTPPDERPGCLGWLFRPDEAERLENEAQRLASSLRHAEAAVLRRRALALLRETRGPRHPRTLKEMSYLAGLTFWGGLDADEAEALYLELVAAHEAVDGPGHVAVADVLDRLGALYATHGRHAEAAAARARALDIRRRTVGELDWTTWNTRTRLAGAYEQLGKWDAAEAVYREVLAIAPDDYSADLFLAALQLRRAPPRVQVAYAAACLERAPWPYDRGAGPGDDRPRRAAALLWRHADGDAVAPEEVAALQAALAADVGAGDEEEEEPSRVVLRAAQAGLAMLDDGADRADLARRVADLALSNLHADEEEEEEENGGWVVEDAWQRRALRALLAHAGHGRLYDAVRPLMDEPRGWTEEGGKG